MSSLASVVATAILLASGLGAQVPAAPGPSCTVPKLPPTVITFGPGPGADEIAGRVLNSQTLEPFVGALIDIPSRRTSVKSDSGGRFRFIGIPHGNYEVRVRALGFQTGQSAIVYEGPTKVLVALSSSAVPDFECVRPAAPRPPKVELKPTATARSLVESSTLER